MRAMRYLGVREPTDWERNHWQGTVDRVLDFVGEVPTDRVGVPVRSEWAIDDALLADATRVAEDGLIEAKRRSLL